MHQVHITRVSIKRGLKLEFITRSCKWLMDNGSDLDCGCRETHWRGMYGMIGPYLTCPMGTTDGISGVDSLTRPQGDKIAHDSHQCFPFLPDFPNFRPSFSWFFTGFLNLFSEIFFPVMWCIWPNSIAKLFSWSMLS